MKKVFFIAIAAIMFSSCCHRVFMTQSLENKYNERMSSRSERAVKEKIQILSPKDADGLEYEIVSYNNYRPFMIPLLRSYKKQMTKKAYQRIAQKTYEEGGNAAIITGFGNTWAGGASFQVIRLK
jgi:hypothetical protein